MSFRLLFCCPGIFYLLCCKLIVFICMKGSFDKPSRKYVVPHALHVFIYLLFSLIVASFFSCWSLSENLCSCILSCRCILCRFSPFCLGIVDNPHLKPKPKPKPSPEMSISLTWGPRCSCGWVGALPSKRRRAGCRTRPSTSSRPGGMWPRRRRACPRDSRMLHSRRKYFCWDYLAFVLFLSGNRKIFLEEELQHKGEWG